MNDQTQQRAQPAGQDTPTGASPEAEYEQPGYEDKSLGQAVQQDEELVDELLDAADGDEAAAEAAFESESAGRPARERQGRPETA
ncbi:MAG: hypothetical protein ACYC2O_09665 [Microthrixaceae bacterium]